MKPIAIIMFLSLVGFSSLNAQSTWFQERSRELDEAETLPPLERIEKVGDLLGIGKGKSLNEEQKIVFARVQKMILAIPGHARYYADRLEQKKRELLEGKTSYHEYTLEQENLLALAFLPSAETVSVLGGLLQDPVGRDGKALGGGNLWEGNGILPVNCQIAVSYLENLPIENGPKLTKEDFGISNFSGVDKWKEWWEEIKTGKRTYRFVGSPIEYGPDGPVSPKELQRREHDRQRDSDHRDHSVERNKETSSPATHERGWPWASLIGSVVAGILLLLLALKVIRKSPPGR